MNQKIVPLLMMSLSLVTFVGTAAYAREDFANLKQALKPPARGKLSNGIEVVWFENDTVPLIDFVLVIKGGSRDDPQGKSGLSQLWSQTLTKGANGKSQEQLARELESIGGEAQFSAGEDASTLTVHGLSKNAPELLQYLSDVARSPEFPEKSVIEERGRLIERIRQMGEDVGALASLALHERITLGTPYSRGAFSSMRELSTLKRKDVSAFHESLLRPERLVLAVVGKFDRALIRKDLERVFGSWKGRGKARVPPARAQNQGPLPRKRFVWLTREGTTQIQLRVGLRVPSLHTPDRYALAAANVILGESYSSLLNRVLRDELALTYGAGSAISQYLDFGVWGITVSTRNDSFEKLLTQFRRTLVAIGTTPVTEDVLNEAKAYIRGSVPLSLASSAQLASRWIGRSVFDLPEDDLWQSLERIERLTPEMVTAAFQKHLDLEHAVWVAIGSKSQMKKVDQSLFGPIEEVDASSLLK